MFLENKRILLIEDDEILIGKLINIFSDNHLKRLVVKSYYNEALEELQSDQEYDLIICDIMLPISKGDFENTKSLKTELLEQINKIIQIEDEGGFSNQKINFLEQARARRAVISQEINTCIDQEGGVKLLKYLSRNNTQVVTPIIILSAAVSDTFKVINMYPNFKKIEVIPKPCSIEHLTNCMKNFLK